MNRASGWGQRFHWILIASISCVAQPSQAFLGGGCLCSTIGAYHEGTRQHVTEETTEAAEDIVSALRAQTRQTSAYLDRQVEAFKRIADGQQQNDTLRLREEIRAEAESGKFDPNSDFCFLMDLSHYKDFSPDWILPTSTSIGNSARSWSRGETRPVQVNGLQMAAWLAEEQSALESAGGYKDPTTDWGLAFDNSTIPADQTGVDRALTRLVANTVDPQPPQPLTEADRATPAGLAESVIRGAVAARKGASIASIQYSLDLGMPTAPADVYRTMAGRSHYDKSVPDVISELQRLDIRTSAYYAPKLEVLDERHAKNERALLQDLIDIQSLATRIQYLRLEQETRNAVVLAAILGLMTDGATTNLPRQ